LKSKFAKRLEKGSIHTPPPPPLELRPNTYFNKYKPRQKDKASLDSNTTAVWFPQSNTRKNPSKNETQGGSLANLD